MMLIGTSFGGCLKSLAKGEVIMDDVLVVITRTACKELSNLIQVVEDYHAKGNFLVTKPDNYELGDQDLDTLKSIASDLWHGGKIHQPRLFHGGSGFQHVEMSRNEIWIPLAPSPKTDEQIVVDAYQKYQILRNLMA